MKPKIVSYITKEGIIEKRVIIKEKRLKRAFQVPIADGTAIVVPLFLFLILGKVLDAHFKTKQFVLIGIVMGTIATAYNLLRLVKNNNAKH